MQKLGNKIFKFYIGALAALLITAVQSNASAQDSYFYNNSYSAYDNLFANHGFGKIKFQTVVDGEVEAANNVDAQNITTTSGEAVTNSTANEIVAAQGGEISGTDTNKLDSGSDTTLIESNAAEVKIDGAGTFEGSEAINAEVTGDVNATDTKIQDLETTGLKIDGNNLTSDSIFADGTEDVTFDGSEIGDFRAQGADNFDLEAIGTDFDSLFAESGEIDLNAEGTTIGEAELTSETDVLFDAKDTDVGELTAEGEITDIKFEGGSIEDGSLESALENNATLDGTEFGRIGSISDNDTFNLENITGKDITLTDEIFGDEGAFTIGGGDEFNITDSELSITSDGAPISVNNFNLENAKIGYDGVNARTLETPTFATGSEISVNGSDLGQFNLDNSDLSVNASNSSVGDIFAENGSNISVNGLNDINQLNEISVRGDGTSSLSLNGDISNADVSRYLEQGGFEGVGEVSLNGEAVGNGSNGSFLDSTRDFLSDAVTNTREAIGEGVNNFKEGINTANEFITDKIVSPITDKVKDIGNGISDRVGQVNDTLRNGISLDRESATPFDPLDGNLSAANEPREISWEEYQRITEAPQPLRVVNNNPYTGGETVGDGLQRSFETNTPNLPTNNTSISDITNSQNISDSLNRFGIGEPLENGSLGNTSSNIAQVNNPDLSGAAPRNNPQYTPPSHQGNAPNTSNNRGTGEGFASNSPHAQPTYDNPERSELPITNNGEGLGGDTSPNSTIPGRGDSYSQPNTAYIPPVNGRPGVSQSEKNIGAPSTGTYVPPTTPVSNTPTGAVSNSTSNTSNPLANVRNIGGSPNSQNTSNNTNYTPPTLTQRNSPTTNTSNSGGINASVTPPRASSTPTSTPTAISSNTSRADTYRENYTPGSSPVQRNPNSNVDFNSDNNSSLSDILSGLSGLGSQISNNNRPTTSPSYPQPEQPKLEEVAQEQPSAPSQSTQSSGPPEITRDLRDERRVSGTQLQNNGHTDNLGNPARTSTLVLNGTAYTVVSGARGSGPAPEGEWDVTKIEGDSRSWSGGQVVRFEEMWDPKLNRLRTGIISHISRNGYPGTSGCIAPECINGNNSGLSRQQVYDQFIADMRAEVQKGNDTLVLKYDGTSYMTNGQTNRNVTSNNNQTAPQENVTSKPFTEEQSQAIANNAVFDPEFQPIEPATTPNSSPTETSGGISTSIPRTTTSSTTSSAPNPVRVLQDGALEIDESVPKEIRGRIAQEYNDLVINGADWDKIEGKLNETHNALTTQTPDEFRANERAKLEQERIEREKIEKAEKTKKLSDLNSQASKLRESGVIKKSTSNSIAGFDPSEFTFGREARLDKNGNVKVYYPPAGDGGGAYEVAGITARYQPNEAKHLRSLVQNGQHAAAKRYAKEYFRELSEPYTKHATNPGLQLQIADTVHHRGAGIPKGGHGYKQQYGGLLNVLQRATGDFSTNDRAALIRKLDAMPDALDRFNKARVAHEWEDVDRGRASRKKFRGMFTHRFPPANNAAKAAEAAWKANGGGNNVFSTSTSGDLVLADNAPKEVRDLVESYRDLGASDQKISSILSGTETFTDPDQLLSLGDTKGFGGGGINASAAKPRTITKTVKTAPKLSTTNANAEFEAFEGSVDGQTGTGKNFISRTKDGVFEASPVGDDGFATFADGTKISASDVEALGGVNNIGKKLGGEAAPKTRGTTTQPTTKEIITNNAGSNLPEHAIHHEGNNVLRVNEDGAAHMTNTGRLVGTENVNEAYRNARANGASVEDAVKSVNDEFRIRKETVETNQPSTIAQKDKIVDIGKNGDVEFVNGNFSNATREQITDLKGQGKTNQEVVDTINGTQPASVQTSEQDLSKLSPEFLKSGGNKAGGTETKTVTLNPDGSDPTYSGFKVTKEELPRYKTNADGSIVKDSKGNPVFNEDVTKVVEGTLNGKKITGIVDAQGNITYTTDDPFSLAEADVPNNISQIPGQETGVIVGTAPDGTPIYQGPQPTKVSDGAGSYNGGSYCADCNGGSSNYGGSGSNGPLGAASSLLGGSGAFNPLQAIMGLLGLAQNALGGGGDEDGNSGGNNSQIANIDDEKPLCDKENDEVAQRKNGKWECVVTALKDAEIAGNEEGGVNIDVSEGTEEDIEGTENSDLVVASEVIDTEVNLGAGNDAIDAKNSRIAQGGVVNLGGGKNVILSDRIVNEGEISGDNVMIVGDIVQTEDGKIIVTQTTEEEKLDDVDTVIEPLKVAGNAILDGVIEINVRNKEELLSLKPGDKVTVVRSNGAIIDNGVVIEAPVKDDLYAWTKEVDQETGELNAVLGYAKADCANVESLSDEAKSICNSISKAAQENDTFIIPDVQALLANINDSDLTKRTAALESMSAEGYISANNSISRAVSNFLNIAHDRIFASDKANRKSGDYNNVGEFGKDKKVKNYECSAYGGYINGNGSGGENAHKYTTSSDGVFVAGDCLQDNYKLGAMVSYVTKDIDEDSGFDSSSRIVSVGGYGSYALDNGIKLSGIASLNAAKTDVTRTTNAGSASSTSVSDFATYVLGFKGEAGYDLHAGSVLFRPYGGLEYQYIRSGEALETGDNISDLDVSHYSTSYASANLGARAIMDKRIGILNNMLVSPYIETEIVADIIKMEENIEAEILGTSFTSYKENETSSRLRLGVGVDGSMFNDNEINKHNLFGHFKYEQGLGGEESDSVLKLGYKYNF